MTPELLQRAGEALYGLRWQTELANDLEIADRTMRRWMSGDSPIPDGVNIDLLRMIDGRAQVLADLVEPLKRT